MVDVKDRMSTYEREDSQENVQSCLKVIELLLEQQKTQPGKLPSATKFFKLDDLPEVEMIS